MRIVVAGNPNVGKTSLFNLLTGSRYKVGNYPGVTVESREGVLRRSESASPGLDSSAQSGEITLVDLPGTYSLVPTADDERIAYECLTGRKDGRPDAILVVVDASNLPRNLYFVHQIQELGFPYRVAVNMIDHARTLGRSLDCDALAEALGVEAVATSAKSGEGVDRLVKSLRAVPSQLDAPDGDVANRSARGHREWGRDWQPRDCAAYAQCMEVLGQDGLPPGHAHWLICCAAAQSERAALSLDDQQLLASLDALGSELVEEAAARIIEARYAQVDALLENIGAQFSGAATQNKSAALGGVLGAENKGQGNDRMAGSPPTQDWSSRIDQVLVHRWAGPLIFFGVMVLLFQAIFSWAEPFMGWVETGIAWAGEQVTALLGPGLWTDLLVEGVLAGAGNVLVFLPQIAMLFIFLGLLEDSGYMARAAFLVDRVMSRVGLHGRAFVPILSGYACSIPAIMGTRSIERFRDRLVTILMIPFTSCSARLPIYLLILGAWFPVQQKVWGPLELGGLMLGGAYLLSLVSALVFGTIYKKVLIGGDTPPLVLELPPYRVPRLLDVLRHTWDRCKDFLRDAGTIILCITILLWGALTFPRVQEDRLLQGQSSIEMTVGGRIGKAMEPALEPIGQDWRVGIGLIGSFAAREVLVSTLGLVYGIEDAEENEQGLRETLRNATDPTTGDLRYSPLSGLALMVFFVYAAQCMSTLAVVRRETRSWRWPIFMFVTMTGIAYLAALVVYQGGQWLGFS